MLKLQTYDLTPSRVALFCFCRYLFLRIADMLFLAGNSLEIVEDSFFLPRLIFEIFGKLRLIET